MKKGILTLLIFAILLFLAGTQAFAAPNNKVGIHLAVVSEQGLREAANLVNSSGGDWGYVTVVIQENDRNKEKWQRFFDKMRELHLIPIVRLATSPLNSGWREPKPEEAKDWTEFLDSLNWVVKNRYVVLFNEPNYAEEWGGKVDPDGYGQVALEFAQTLKEKSPDFKIMLAGFDAAAPHQPPNYESEKIFLEKMFKAIGGPNELFKHLDFWASHSYQPTLYLSELSWLRGLGVAQTLPVFITEAGWPHAEGVQYDKSLLPSKSLTKNFLNSFSNWLNDPKLMAITPFVLDYQSEPFDHFSWKKVGSDEFLSPYGEVQAIKKIKGEPEQEQKLALAYELPKKLTRNSSFHLPVVIRNEGQAIWSQADGYKLEITGAGKNFEYFFSNFENLFPYEEGTLWLHFKTGNEIGKFELSLVVSKDGKAVSNPITWDLETVAPVTIQLQARLFPFRKAAGDDFKLLIYDSKEEVVFERSRVSFKAGVGELAEVNNLAIGGKYRLVLLKPYYLPRQTFLIISEDKNRAVFKAMLGLDFNLDGRLSIYDIIEIIKRPSLLLHL
jgi:hypothetical protein